MDESVSSGGLGNEGGAFDFASLMRSREIDDALTPHGDVPLWGGDVRVERRIVPRDHVGGL